MEQKELMEQLDALKVKLEGKTAEEVKTAIDAFKVEQEKAFKGLSTKDELKKAQEDLNEAIKAVQEHADKLDVKMQKGTVKEGEEKDGFKELIRKNFDNIKNVNKTNGLKIDVKDMTLSNALTGDQPRTYSGDVVRRHSQIVNISDLVRPVNISGGTYTYTRSTLASGAVATQTEGASKAQLEYDYTMVDANTDFIAGIAVYSKKMKNNLPFLESTLGMDLRDDYNRGENTEFQTILASQATASSEVAASFDNKAEMLIKEVSNLASVNASANAIVITPADYHSLLSIEKSTGAGYGLPIGWTFDGGVLRCLGIPVYQAAVWLPANKYYVGNWDRVKKIVTEGFSFAVSEEDSDNFRKNNITARVESQVTLTVERPSDLIYGDFTAV